MPDILSSDELSDLLAVADESAEQKEGLGEHGGKSVSPYDFRRPSRLSRAQIRHLQRLYESALEGLTGALSQGLRTPVEANVLGVKALNYGTFANTLPSPTYVNTFRIEPFAFRGLLTIDVPFCLALVDRLLGGHGHATEKPRHLTAIELAVLDWPVRMILEQLQRNWHHEPAVQFVSESRRMDMSFTQIMHTSETMLRVSFALGGEIGSGEAHFCVPFAALEKAMPFDQLRVDALGSVAKLSEQDVQNSKENLKQVSVTVAAELGTAALTLREVLDLRPGQVVALRAKANKAIPVKVEDTVKFYAVPGLRGRLLAVQITDVISNK